MLWEAPSPRILVPEENPGPRDRGPGQAALRPGDRPDPARAGPDHRATHGRQVPGGARHSPVAPAAAPAQEALRGARPTRGQRDLADDGSLLPRSPRAPVEALELVWSRVLLMV